MVGGRWLCSTSDLIGNYKNELFKALGVRFFCMSLSMFGFYNSTVIILIHNVLFIVYAVSIGQGCILFGFRWAAWNFLILNIFCIMLLYKQRLVEKPFLDE